MMTSPFPQDYAQWRHCITVECGVPLTTEFVSERLAVWRNPDQEETARFRRLYGDDHWRAVLAWFERAAQELARQ